MFKLDKRLLNKIPNTRNRLHLYEPLTKGIPYLPPKFQSVFPAVGYIPTIWPHDPIAE